MKKYNKVIVSAVVLLLGLYLATLLIPQRPSVESQYNKDAIQSFENADPSDELTPPIPEF